ELGHRGDELEPGQLVVQGVGFRAQADAAERVRVGEGGHAGDAHLAEARSELARDEAQEGGLARAVGPEQAPHAGLEVDRDVGESRDAPIPLRQPRRADEGGIAHVITSALRSRWRAKVPAPAVQTASAMSAWYQVSSPEGASVRSSASPSTPRVAGSEASLSQGKLPRRSTTDAMTWGTSISSRKALIVRARLLPSAETPTATVETLRAMANDWRSAGKTRLAHSRRSSGGAATVRAATSTTAGSAQRAKSSSATAPARPTRYCRG